MKSPSRLSRRKELGAKVIYEALKYLNKIGRETSLQDVRVELEKRVTLNDWAKETLKSGRPRWEELLQIFSIDYKKAGFLIKEKGMWSLGAKGRNALQLGEIGLLKAAIAEGVTLNEDQDQKIIDLTNKIIDIDRNVRQVEKDSEEYLNLRKKFNEIVKEIKNIIFDL
jgi:restriction system protein